MATPNVPLIGQHKTKGLTKTFTPIGDLVCLELIKSSQQQTKGGLIVPDTVEWESVLCRVIAIGPKCEQVKEGDTVLLANSTMCALVRYQNMEYHLVPEKTLGGVISSSSG